MSYLREDFYLCKDTNFIPQNISRIFRLDRIYEGENGEMKFVPMKDNVYITNQHINANGEVTTKVQANHMVLAMPNEIEMYMIHAFENCNNSLKLHHNSEVLINFYKDMMKEFDDRNIFNKAKCKVTGFHRNDVYGDDEKLLLNLFRSYYKCRVLRK